MPVPADARQASAQAAAADRAVFDTDDPRYIRRSRAGICYDSSDGTWAQLVYFRAYRSMQDCLASGGRRGGR